MFFYKDSENFHNWKDAGSNLAVARKTNAEVLADLLNLFSIQKSNCLC
jgi:hypothetical protein